MEIRIRKSGKVKKRLEAMESGSRDREKIGRAEYSLTQSPGYQERRGERLRDEPEEGATQKRPEKTADEKQRVAVKIGKCGRGMPHGDFGEYVKTALHAGQDDENENAACDGGHGASYINVYTFNLP